MSARVVMDEQHAMLQITDRLSIIEDATDYDAKGKISQMCYTSVNWLSLSTFAESVLEYGKRGIHLGGTGRLEFTSLMEEMKKKLMKHLPLRLTERYYLHPN